MNELDENRRNIQPRSEHRILGINLKRDLTWGNNLKYREKAVIPTLRKKLGTKITHHNRLSSDLERELFRRLFFTGWGGTGGEEQTTMYGFLSNKTSK